MSHAVLDYQTIFAELNRRKVRYVVAGGVAVNLHGIPRMTYDIDLMIDLEPENIERTISVFLKWGFHPRAPVDPHHLADETIREGWIRDRNMRAFTLVNEEQPIGEIDLLIDMPIPYNEVSRRAVRVDVGDDTVPVISIDDLIAVKRNTGRKQDEADVELLQKIRKVR